MSDFKVGDRVKILNSTLGEGGSSSSFIGREGIIKKVYEYDNSGFGSPMQSDYDVAIIGEAHNDLPEYELPGYNHYDLELVIVNE